MKTLVIYEFDVPNKGKMLDEYLEYTRSKEFREWMDKIQKAYNLKASGWANGTGKVIFMGEYENIDDFSKVWSNKEYQNKMAKISNLVHNMNMRIFYPAR
jgi:hypothetical protein